MIRLLHTSVTALAVTTVATVLTIIKNYRLNQKIEEVKKEVTLNREGVTTHGHAMERIDRLVTED